MIFDMVEIFFKRKIERVSHDKQEELAIYTTRFGKKVYLRNKHKGMNYGNTWYF